MFFIDSTEVKLIGFGCIISPATSFLHGEGILSVIIGIYFVLVARVYSDLVNLKPT